MFSHSSDLCVIAAVPTVVPLSQDTDTYNGTAIIPHWVPVEDTREGVGGKVKGYRVRQPFLNNTI